MVMNTMLESKESHETNHIQVTKSQQKTPPKKEGVHHAFLIPTNNQKTRPLPKERPGIPATSYRPSTKIRAKKLPPVIQLHGASTSSGRKSVSTWGSPQLGSVTMT